MKIKIKTTEAAAPTGSGTASLDYGNCFEGERGKVNVYLNSNLIDVAKKNTFSKKVAFDFFPNDVLLLSETDVAIIKLNSLTLSCKGNNTFSMYKRPVVLIYKN